MSISPYIYISQSGLPYGTCWNWDAVPGGTQFAARADSWKPVYPDDREYQCLPDPIPAEFQVWNLPPPCPEAECSVCTGPRAAGMIAHNGGSCPSCKRDMMSLQAGYAWNKPVQNPILYQPPYRDVFGAQ